MKFRLREALPHTLRTRVRAGEGLLRARRAIHTRPGAVTHVPPTAFRPLLKLITRRFPTVLDVGCGPMRTLSTFENRVRVGVDAHRPYLERRDRDPSLVPLHLDARRLDEVFVPRSFSLVVMLDFVEHLEKDVAFGVMESAETIASRRCVVFTPRGWFPQEEYDAWNLGAETFQKHRSAWEPSEFAERDYAVVVVEALHGPGNDAFERSFGAESKPVDAILAWKDLALADGAVSGGHATSAQDHRPR